MNADVKAQWLAALRSANYQQGRNRLRDSEDHFCCLGVLCDIVAPGGWSPDTGGYLYNGHAGYPPEEIFDRTALTHDHAERLASLNDGGFSFDFIADHIERKL